MIASRSVFRYQFLYCSCNRVLLFLNFEGEGALAKTVSLLYRDYSITKLYFLEFKSSFFTLLYYQCCCFLFSFILSLLCGKEELLVILLFLWWRFANYRALCLMISDISRRVRGSMTGSMRLLFFKLLALGLIGGFLAPLIEWLALVSFTVKFREVWLLSSSALELF